MYSEEALNILYEAMKSPKRAKNDAGEVETHDLDKLVKALDLARKFGAANVDPFRCVAQSNLPRRDIWT